MGGMGGMGGMGMTGMASMPQNMMGPGMNGDPNVHMPDGLVGNGQGGLPGAEGMVPEGLAHPYGGMQLGVQESHVPNAPPFNAFPAGYIGETAPLHGEQSLVVPGGPARNVGHGGRGTPPARAPAVTGAMRGRGRGAGFPAGDKMPVLPTRPASPLPPNVPTGPRNRTTYKDKDREPVRQDVEGLDYGGGMVVDASTASRKRPFAGEEDNGRSKRR